jgi:hypothetical protein
MEKELRGIMTMEKNMELKITIKLLEKNGLLFLIKEKLLAKLNIINIKDLKNYVFVPFSEKKFPLNFKKIYIKDN